MGPPKIDRRTMMQTRTEPSRNRGAAVAALVAVSLAGC